MGSLYNSMELNQIKNTKHRAIITDINNGKDIQTILSTHGMSRSNYQWIKRKYNQALIVGKPLELTEIKTGQYESDIVEKGKYVAIKLINTLMHKNYSGTSVNQLMTSLVNVNNMIRLQEGKSTENIAHNVVHNLNEQQLTLIKEATMNLKKSMLNSDS